MRIFSRNSCSLHEESEDEKRGEETENDACHVDMEFINYHNNYPQLKLVSHSLCWSGCRLGKLITKNTWTEICCVQALGAHGR